jgi:hypothetical protein
MTADGFEVIRKEYNYCGRNAYSNVSISSFLSNPATSMSSDFTRPPQNITTVQVPPNIELQIQQQQYASPVRIFS